MQYGQINDRVGDALRRRYNVTPDFQLSLTPEISGVIPMEMPEILYHQGWRRWQSGARLAAVAAQAGRVQFRVIDTSTAIVVLERVLITCEAATQFVGDWGYGPGAVDLATLTTTPEPRDFRQRPSAGSGTVIISTTTSAAIVTPTAFSATRQANAELDVPGGPWVVSAGFQLLMGVTALNTNLDYTFVWRERPANESETAP